MKQRNGIIKFLLPVLLAVLLFSLLLESLYRYDNKYTHDGLQPISGLLVLSEKDLQEESVYYLTREWHFYPGTLLTPWDFVGEGGPDAYMQTVTIGQQSNFFLKNLFDQTGGKASYHLRLALPETERVYTLVLPEIYSAYRLYIDGEERLSVGVPESYDFSEAIARKSVSFTAGGTVDLLLAVSNRSHFSDGMTYPPIFGETESVHTLETTRLVLGGITFVVSLLCTLSVLFVLIALNGRRDRKIPLLFCASLCITVTYIYPILFFYTEVSSNLWYGVELFGLYGCCLFAVLLQNEICDMKPRMRTISKIVLLTFCVFALCYSLLPVYQVWVIKLFGLLSTAVKVFTVGYLMLCAAHSYRTDHYGSSLLLFCTTAFGISVLFDRIHSNWEPILGGWPIEYGNAILIMGFILILWKAIVEGYRFRLTFIEEKKQLTRQVAIQKVHYLELTKKIEDTVQMRHDERHHLQTLYSIYETKDYDRLGKYLSEYVLTSMPKEQTVLCKNLIVDAMLRYYKTLCEKSEISFSCIVNLPPSLPISDVEISILFGNLLENAYEAARQEGCPEPFLSLRAKTEKDRLYLLLENRFIGSVERKGDRLISTKHDGLGIGTQSVRSVVESYKGSCIFADKKDVFSVTLMLSMESRQPEKFNK